MDFFIQIKDQAYKIPATIIVGRGEPFTILGKDWDVARSHLKIFSKNGKIYIQDLGSDKGTYLQELKLKPQKKYELKYGDQVIFGGQKLCLLTPEEATDAIVVMRSAPDAHWLSMVEKAVLTFLISFLLVGWFIFNKEDLSLKISASLVILVIFFFCVGMVKIFRKFLPNHELRVKEIFYNQDGFTVHFVDNSNMSFKPSEIQSWSWNKQNKHLTIDQYDQSYVLGIPRNYAQLIEFLNKYHGEELEKAQPHRAIVLAILMVAHSACSFFGSYFYSMILAVLIALYFFVMIFNDQLRSHYLIPVTKIYTRKRQTQSIVFMCFIFLLLSVDSYDKNDLIEKNRSLISACRSFDGQSCRLIDFEELLSQGVRIKKKDAQIACDNNNQSACHYIKQRSIAGEKSK